MLRLSGISPFYKESAKATLENVRTGSWSFDADAFTDISPEAKDFISKLLEKDPKSVRVDK
jgi:serine/threonine protein kinase